MKRKELTQRSRRYGNTEDTEKREEVKRRNGRGKMAT